MEIFPGDVFYSECNFNDSCCFFWYFIYHVDVGLLNNVLKAVGLGAWLTPGSMIRGRP